MSGRGMIIRIWAIALNTFREASRNRVLYGIAVVAFLSIMAATVLGEMSLHEEARVARDVGLSGVSLFGSLTAIVLGVSLLYGEIQRRTIHTIVSKPIHRFEFVLGKYLGMALMLCVIVAVFTASMALLLKIQEVPFSTAITKAVVLSFVEVLLIAAVAIFFSSFSSPFLSGVFTLGVFVLGRTTGAMREALDGDKFDGLIALGLRIGTNVVPDLHLFSVSGSTVKGEHVSVHSDFVSWGYVASASTYGALYITALLALAILIFSRRDFA
jgi:ABC-type transport system involved in multi-copper enzyme maturation permease subunit